MRSGSSLSRYSASRSCARLSGPPVSRTAESGSGRAMSGIALVKGAAEKLLAANSRKAAKRNGVEILKQDFIAVTDAQGEGIRASFKARPKARHMLEMHNGLSDFIQSWSARWKSPPTQLHSRTVP